MSCTTSRPCWELGWVAETPATEAPVLPVHTHVCHVGSGFSAQHVKSGFRAQHACLHHQQLVMRVEEGPTTEAPHM